MTKQSNTNGINLCGGAVETGEWTRLLRHDQLVVLERDVAFDPSLGYQIRHDAVRLLHGHVVLADELQGVEEELEIDLMRLEDEVNLLEEIPVGDDLQLLHDDVNAGVDEERFVLLHDIFEGAHVALL